MHTVTNVHDLHRMTMRETGYGRADLRFECRNLSVAAICDIPIELAERLIEAFHDYDDWMSGQETAPVQDYASAIADLPRQLAEAAKLK